MREPNDGGGYIFKPFSGLLVNPHGGIGETTMARAYVADLPGGTATTTIQIQGNGTLKNVLVSFLSAAVGKIEISTSATSQIGTAQPTQEIAARLNCSATAGNVAVNVPVNVPLKAFQNLYIHQTGAGNLGSVSFYV